ncbi:hypothetical protein NL493_28540, partial [Klebsiella pneumoniae]|nr:hypothetical protein [Klebsiella pneumoniae]MCP6646095.1 hypothetical protein [Klebsiella pneumoniae]
PLYSIKSPELHGASARALDYGEIAGRYCSACLQTLLFRDEVVTIPQAAPILESLTGHGCTIVEISLYHP